MTAVKAYFSLPSFLTTLESPSAFFSRGLVTA